MKRISLFVFILFLSFIFSAIADEISTDLKSLVPYGGQIIDDQSVGSFRVLSIEIKSTGEEIQLTFDTMNNRPISLNTEIVATVISGTVQSREGAEKAVYESYPTAKIIFSQDGADGEKKLYIFTDTLCGSISICGDAIISRSLSYGELMKNGYLTLQGALTVLAVHRPEADFIALEFDEDDGMLLYEGDALVDGEKYEFEMDACSGKLLEWERD